jgi:hypothetical protein
MRLTSIILAVLFLSIIAVSAQTITVTNDQGLAFGNFWQAGNSGGTVTLSNTGARSSTGDVVLLNSTFFHSIFNITTESLSPVSITVDQPTAILSGSNGGSMTLEIGPPSPASPSVSALSPVQVSLGGTLTIGSRSNNPPGTYSGDVMITFTVNNQ